MIDDLFDKLESVYKNLEADRKKALEELDALHNDIEVTDAKFRHLGREVCGQLIKLAIDASVAQAKVLEPLTKNQVAGAPTAGGSSVNKRDLIDALEALEGRPVKPVDTAPPIMEDTIPAAIAAAEEAEVKALAAAAQSQGLVIDANDAG